MTSLLVLQKVKKGLLRPDRLYPVVAATMNLYIGSALSSQTQMLWNLRVERAPPHRKDWMPHETRLRMTTIGHLGI